MALDQPITKVQELLGVFKDNFWLERLQQGKTEAEIQQEWISSTEGIGSLLAASAPSNHYPRQPIDLVSQDDASGLGLTATPVEAVSMQRRRTEQPAPPSLQATREKASLNPRKRANSSNLGVPPSLDTNMQHSYSLFPQADFPSSQKMRRTPSNPRPTKRVDAQTLSPLEYLAQNQFSSSPNRPSSFQGIASNCMPQHIPGSPLMPSPLSSSYNSSAPPPLTPDDVSINSASLISPANMSRQGSLGGEFRAGFSNALNFNTQAAEETEYHEFLARPLDRGYTNNVRTISAMHTTLPKTVPEGSEQETSPVAVSAPESSPLAIFDQQTPKASELQTMRHFSDGNIAQNSSPRRSQASPSERPLKPKATVGDFSNAAGGHSMLRIKSDIGVSSEKWQIPKAPYNRPAKEKLKCNMCDKHPNGFRGDHELRRHQKLVHSKTRSAWICIDDSKDGSMLSKCRACQAKKQYGAYYNAAAHLRRCHFNPKQGGRKARGQSDRAGKGGGDQPPMDELKKNWIREVDYVPTISAADDDDDDGDSIEENAIAEQMVKDEQEHRPKVDNQTFDGFAWPDLTMPMNGENGYMAVANAGTGCVGTMFGNASDWQQQESAFDPLNWVSGYDDDLLFGFEPHATTNNA